MTHLTTEGLLADAIRKRLMRTIVIKDGKAFERLYRELQAALTRAWSEQMREGIVAALDRLRDLGSGAFTPDTAAAIMTALEERVGTDALTAAMRQPVINLSDALFRAGAAEVGKATGIDIAFMRPDLDALDALKNNNLFWIGETWNSHTKGKIDTILTEYFETGLTRDELAQRIADDFRSLTSRSEVYWEAVADHMATKGREIGRVTGYVRAGIQRVQIRAHLDERTTPVCRHLHGRVIEVSTLEKQRDDYFDACARGDVGRAKSVWQMHGKGTDLSSVPTSELEGIGSPPYHFRCRTITVAYWEPPASERIAVGVVGGEPLYLHAVEQKTFDRKPLTKKEIGALIDRAKSADWATPAKRRLTFDKHHDALRIRTQADFSQAAVDLIRRGNRDVYLKMETLKNGSQELRLVFEGAATTSTGAPAIAKTVVAVEDNHILSYHRAKPHKSEAVRGGVRQAARGIMKGFMEWLIG